MDDKKRVEDLLAQHKQALNEYFHWDAEVKTLLKGRLHKDLTSEEITAYRDVAANRDAAYDRMRHFERMLLNAIPDSDTGDFPAFNKFK